MAITAKQVTETISQGEYELFKEVEATSIDDKKVTIKQSIGRYSVDRLERQKANLQAEIDEIDEKLNAINEIA